MVICSSECRPESTTLKMSSVLNVRNKPKLHWNLAADDQVAGSLTTLTSLLTPASTVCATACFNGGSATKKLSNRHGRAGSAQASSAGVGARFDSEHPP
jgi:hypothetical protein